MMMDHKPAEFRHLVTFQAETTLEDSEGFKSKSWTNVVGLVDKLAKFEYVTGREVLAAGQTNAVHDIVVTIYFPDVSPDESMIMLVNAVRYTIESMVPDDTGRIYLELRVKKEIP